MEFLKLFQTHEEYETLVSSGTMVKPNVSHCIQENEVHYNKYIEPIIAKYYIDEEAIEETGSYPMGLYYYKNTSTGPIIAE